MIFITSEDELDMKVLLQAFYFYANRDPFHKKILTMISNIEKTYKTTFFAIDVDQFPNQCKRFKISSVSTTLIMQSGKEINRIEGIISTKSFKSIFDDIYNLDTPTSEKNNAKETAS